MNKLKIPINPGNVEVFNFISVFPVQYSLFEIQNYYRFEVKLH